MPWPPPTLLCALALALDVVAVVAFSTVTHPYKPWTYITQIWPHHPYKFGESTLDLCAAALVRALLFSVLLRLSSARRAAAQQALLAQPLNVDVPPPPRPRMSAKRATLLFRIGFGVTLTHTAAKALARLLQAGIDPSTGSLPSPTTPTEVWFWLAVAAAPTLALVELTFGAKAAAAAAKAAGGEGGEDGEAAGGGAGGTGKKGEGDPAAEVKKAYIKRTEPKEIRSIARMATMMRVDWQLLTFAYCNMAVAAAGDATVPMLYGVLIDAIAIDQDVQKFQMYMGFLILNAMITGLCTGFRGSTFIVLGGRFSKRLREHLFGSLLSQEADFFGAVKTGDITSRLSADCQKVGDQVQLNVQVFFRSLIQAVITLVWMFVINPKLAATCFVVVPAIVYASRIFGDYMRTLSTETQDSLAEANSVAEEVVAAISTTRCHAAEAEEQRRYAIGMDKYVKCCVRTARIYFLYSSLTYTFLPYATYCLVLYYGAQLTNTPAGCTSKGDHCGTAGNPPCCEMDGAGLISFVLYMQSLFASFNGMINIYTALAQAVGAADKVMKWIAREPLIRPPPPAAAAAPASCRGDLKLNNVNFRYALRPEQPVLRGLSLHVAPGEVVALCGPSGGGKSSIISLLERLYEPESGEVLLDDMPLSSLDPRWFHRQVALVAQEPVLFARTIEENITYGLENGGGGGGGEGAAAPGSEEVVRAARLANAHDFIGTFEHAYETVVGERGTQLSGGQKQRVAIARALVRRPAVLLLDEATSALDAESEAVVQAAIDSMIEQGGMTVLVVAHRLSTIRNADRIVIISAGAVKESGKHDELLALKGEYANLVARQMHSSSRGELEQMGRGK